MTTQVLQPRWIAGAALTVLSSAVVAAVALASAPATSAAPASTARVVATDQSAPVPVAVTRTATAPVKAAPKPVTAKPAGVRRSTAPAQAAPAKPALSKPVAAARRSDPLCEGTGWEARRGAAAVAQLRRSSDARGGTLAFRPARPDVLGYADLAARKVDVFVRSCARMSDALLLHVVSHELGHLVDGVRMNNDLREQWKAARGIPASTPWFGCSRCSDFATPAGDFAETYAQWQRGSTRSRSQLAPPATRAQLEQLAAKFFRPL